MIGFNDVYCGVRNGKITVEDTGPGTPHGHVYRIKNYCYAPYGEGDDAKLDAYEYLGKHDYTEMAKDVCKVLCEKFYGGIGIDKETEREEEFVSTYLKNETTKIKIRYLSDDIDTIDYIGGKSDWIDLRAAENINMKAGEFKLIPLGIAMELPRGYEAHVVPRSSTFKNFGIIQANSMGIIDESYCGDDDEWMFPAIAMRDTGIKINDRICQFRIMKHQPIIEFDEVEELRNGDRGGFGSTGVK